MFGFSLVWLAVGCTTPTDTDDSEPESPAQPCVVVSPASIDFGGIYVTIDPPVTRQVTIENVCEGDLDIASVEVSGTSPFVVGALLTERLAPGETTMVDVTFDPQTDGTWNAELLVSTHDSESPTATVQLLGVGTAPRIEVTPYDDHADYDYDFGSPYVGCPLEQPFTIENRGNADLVVSQLQFATGTVDFDFHAEETVPFTIAPGSGVDVYVRYVGLDEFEDRAYLTVESNDPWTPEVVRSVAAQAVKYGDNLDVFEQLGAGTPADVLVVVDDSSSMGAEQSQLAASIDSFVAALETAGSDYQVAVITTDDPTFRGDVVTPASADPAAELAAQVLAGTGGSEDPQPMEMAWQATQPDGDAAPGGAFLRDDAGLVILVVTDDADSSPLSPADYVDGWLAIKGDDPDLLRFYAIAGDVPTPPCAAAAGVPLDEAAALAGGELLSVCDAYWDTHVRAVARGVTGIRDSFRLTQMPVPQTIEVTIDGITSHIGWEYDAGANSVVFETDYLPTSGAQIEVQYELMPDCDG